MACIFFMRLRSGCAPDCDQLPALDVGTLAGFEIEMDDLRALSVNQSHDVGEHFRWTLAAHGVEPERRVGELSQWSLPISGKVGLTVLKRIGADGNSA